MAYDYIEPDDIVLELGGRYGTVSNVINHKLISLGFEEKEKNLKM